MTFPIAFHGVCGKCSGAITLTPLAGESQCVCPEEAPNLDSSGHFPGCATSGCRATRCADARWMARFNQALTSARGGRDA